MSLDTFVQYFLLYYMLPLYCVAMVLISWSHARHFRWPWIFAMFGIVGMILMTRDFVRQQLTIGYWAGLLALWIENYVIHKLSARNSRIIKEIKRLKAEGADKEQILALQDKLSPIPIPHTAQETLLRAGTEPAAALLQPAQPQRKDRKEAETLLRFSLHGNGYLLEP